MGKYAYKIDFYSADYAALSDLIQLLHNRNFNFYFAFLGDRFNGSVVVISQEDIQDTLSLFLENAKFTKVPLQIVFGNLVFFKKANKNSYNKSSIKNFILKYFDKLEKAETFEEFVKLAKFGRTDKKVEEIYSQFKQSANKDIEQIAFSVQKKLKLVMQNSQYIQLTSNSNRNFFKIFLKKCDRISFIEDLNFLNNSSFGLIKN